MSNNHGLPTIACLCVLCGVLTAWNVASLVADVKAQHAAMVADRNLAQAEDMLKACFDHHFFIVGTAIYRCEANKSELTTAQFPELRLGAL